MNKITRLVVQGWPKTDAEQAEEALYSSLLTITEPTKFLTTPGGFVFAPFPSDWTGTFGWDSQPEELLKLAQAAVPYVSQVISPRVLAASDGKVEYLTLGLDLRSLNTNLHAELVAIINMSTGSILRWTGKSYPTPDQEKSLIHITDIASHTIQLDQERVLLLGCHDLNVFNGRARANQKIGGLRHRRCQAMLQQFDNFQPTAILQHPHATDTWKSWIQPWRETSRRYLGASWASAIAYVHPKKPRAPLADVLSKTGDDCLNIIISGRRNPSPLQKNVVPSALG
jgi:hypothetical protein